jgi:hypothetical protein
VANADEGLAIITSHQPEATEERAVDIVDRIRWRFRQFVA